MMHDLLVRRRATRVLRACVITYRYLVIDFDMMMLDATRHFGDADVGLLF